MIRSTLRSMVGRGADLGRARGVRPDVALPFDMFDELRTPTDDAVAAKLAGIYHKGQRKAWDGKELLAELCARHGHPALDDRQREALQGLFAIILWGELAAWKVSAELALQLEPLEAKMAATSQAHDEARHFYVMHDYLALLGPVPRGLGPATTRVLTGTLRADTLTKKLVGMQMMIEPMALALFHLVRKSRVEPVLCELVASFERDEARHVALGVLHLPRLLRGMSTAEAIDLWRWEFGEYWAQLAMLEEIEPHLAAIGLDVHDVIEVGRQRQLRANQLLAEELGAPLPVIAAFLRFFDARVAWRWPADPRAGVRDRLFAAFEAARHGAAGPAPDLTELRA
ncbi:MAG: ferritin-like domain-containing protein [Myxococcota bacterium]